MGRSEDITHIDAMGLIEQLDPTVQITINCSGGIENVVINPAEALRIVKLRGVAEGYHQIVYDGDQDIHGINLRNGSALSLDYITK